MKRTDTTQLASITLQLPAGRVTFKFPSPETQNRTVISIPEHSKWEPGLHWHESYTENVRVLRGRAKIMLNGVTKIYGPDDGIVIFEKFGVHTFCRADVDSQDKDEGPVEITEWTDPEDGFKAVFFYNVMSIFQETGGKVGPSSGLQLLTTIAYVDNYVVIVRGPLGYYLTHGLYVMGRALGSMLGYKTWYEDYTPERYRSVAARQGEVCRKSV